MIVSWAGFLKWGYDLKKYNSITNLPNSCFIDSMIFASRCNLLLSSNLDIWNRVYGYTYSYKDDSESSFGHAVCVFEYKNTLWLYDPNWGTMPVGPAGDKSEYKENIKLYISSVYPIIIKEDYLVDDWFYIQKVKNKMNKTTNQVSIYLEKEKKE